MYHLRLSVLESRRTLWPILAALSRLEQQRGNLTEAEVLHQRASEIIEYIAGHIATPELRATFLQQPEVRVVIKNN